MQTTKETKFQNLKMVLLLFLFVVFLKLKLVIQACSVFFFPKILEEVL